MTPAARVQAAIGILDEIAAGTPAEQALTAWARRSRFAGSGDRAAVRDHVFDVLRCRASCAVLGGGEDGRALMLGLLRAAGTDPDTVFTEARFAPAPLDAAERAAFARDLPDLPPDLPGWLLPELSRSLGPRLAPVAEAMRARAPVHLRVNIGRLGREAAREALRAEGIETRPHPAAETALEVVSGQRGLTRSESYREGLVELQDAASQAVVEMLPLRPGMRVLDYCAGGGGKALAMAARGAEVEAHDIAPARMRDLPERAQRSGARIRCLPPGGAAGAYDLVLCDAPCSGSGAWRRTPDAKWRLTPERLAELTAMQDGILDSAAPLVAGAGVLAHATCSLLDVENEDRVAAFLERHSGWRLLEQRRWRPDAGTDGFYAALLTRKD